jgi:hypothetical protein
VLGFCRGLRWPLAGLFALLAVCVLAAGCSRAPIKLYPVKGKVTYKSQPTEGASVVFQPVDGVTPERPMAYGDAKADGTFELRTEYGAGAAAGDYNVLIMWYGSATGEVLDAKSKLPAKFADPEKPLLKATVKTEPTELEPFALN